MMDKYHVIIVGAGIAGLSLAIQLAEHKMNCIVLEGRIEYDGPTSGVRISGQGVRVLNKMGIRDIGENTERAIMHYGCFTADFAVERTEEESSAIMVTRLAVFEKLTERASALGVEIIQGFKLITATEDVSSVTVTADSGQQITGKFLVGADGVGSTVRKILNPDQSSGKAYAGYLGVGLIAPSNLKKEMSIYHFPRNHVGIASVGRKGSGDVNNNLFLWTHLYLSEKEAKVMTDEKVLIELKRISQGWDSELSRLFEKLRQESDLVIAQGPVYNGTVPEIWFSKNIMLIGDSAHPYGPGGQGISMALKDAEDLCQLLYKGYRSDEEKAAFKIRRAEEAKKFGEAAETRNSPKNQLSSCSVIFLRGLVMKFYHLLNRGVLKSF